MDTLSKFIANFVEFILTPVVALLFALALFYFVQGLIGITVNADKPESRKKGATHLLWGIVGFVIMVSVWGILRAITGSFNIPFPPR